MMMLLRKRSNRIPDFLLFFNATDRYFSIEASSNSSCS